MKIWKRLAVGALSVMMAFSSVACINTPTEDSGEHQHKAVRRAGITPTCEKTGKMEHWECILCAKLFADSACTQEITLTQVDLAKAPHTLTNHARVEATETEHGNIEYWTCNACMKYFADAQGKSEITVEETTLASLVSLVDFLITVPDDRDPIILQLADPQVIDSSTMRDGRLTSQDMIDAWGPTTREDRCYRYIRELVENTKPDLVLVSGDVIYGEFDDDGHLLLEFVQFMEGLNVKWAPVMGNHDIESAKGADWMCQQYENAPNCLFKQGDIMGNGNYTIGIKQGGELRRLIVNMDTNGCTGASQASKNNGQTVHHGNNGYGGTSNTYGTYGLQPDQVEWFKATVNNIKKFVPDVKVTFHMHIAMKYFAVAYNEEYKSLVGDPVARHEVTSGNYLGSSGNKTLYPERVKGHKEGDVGTLLYVIQEYTPDFWDSATMHGDENKEHSIFKQMKALGTDSIFVGHYHSNSVSIVYDGIRFQYGQKCSTYDTTQILKADGTITSGNIYYDAEGNCTSGTPLVGGTVIPMDKETGELKNPYIYYCTNAGKEVDWEQYKNTIG